jgi:PleD family two-component response regulator
MQPFPVSNDAGSRPRASLKGDERLAQKLKFARIMIIEDSAFMRKLIRGLLTSVGIGNVLEVADGLAALRAVGACRRSASLFIWRQLSCSGFAKARAQTKNASREW